MISFEQVFKTTEPQTLSTLPKIMYFALNEFVDVVGKCKGVIKYIGNPSFNPNTRLYGIELEEAIGENDGTVDDVTYFECNHPFGIFVEKTQLEKLKQVNINMYIKYILSIFIKIID